MSISIFIASATCALTLSANHSPPNSDASAEVRALLSESGRDLALCMLLNASQYEGKSNWTNCKVNSVVIAPQADGHPIYLIFKDESFSRKYARPGTRLGHFILIAESGEVLPVFATANVLDDGGEVFDYAGDGRLAIALPVPYEGEVRALHIVPIERTPRSLLSVIVGPPGHSVPSEERVSPEECMGDVCIGPLRLTEMKTVYPWGFKVHPGRSGSPSKIEIGPVQQLADGKPAATFKWMIAASRYAGPQGSVSQGFVRFEPERVWDVISKMKEQSSPAP